MRQLSPSVTLLILILVLALCGAFTVRGSARDRGAFLPLSVSLSVRPPVDPAPLRPGSPVLSETPRLLAGKLASRAPEANGETSLRRSEWLNRRAPAQLAARVGLAQAPGMVVASAPKVERPVLADGIYEVTRRGAGLVYLKGIAAGAPVHVVQADLRDPDVKVGVLVARNGIGRTETFTSMINRTRPAAAITGTFFGLRNGLPTGDIVVNGRAIYRGFIGTALAITDGNVVSFIPTGDGEPTSWSMFDTVVRGGPRLVLSGEIAVNPWEEGFRTVAGNACRARTAVGITAERKLLLVAVKEGVTLRRLAMAMRALGAYHAVALDGGSSTALSFGGRLVATPGRALTNLLVVYADRDRYEKARRHFYYHARRRVLPSGPPTFSLAPEPMPETGTGDERGEPTHGYAVGETGDGGQIPAETYIGTTGLAAGDAQNERQPLGLVSEQTSQVPVPPADSEQSGPTSEANLKPRNGTDAAPRLHSAGARDDRNTSGP